MSELDIRIVRISEVDGKHHIHRWEMLRYGNSPEEISVDLKACVEDDVASECLVLRLEALYTYMRSMVRRPLLDYAWRWCLRYRLSPVMSTFLGLATASVFPPR